MPNVAHEVRVWWDNQLPRRKRAYKILAAFAAVAVVAAAVIVPIALRSSGPSPCMREGATDVVHQGANHECIGFTDGSFVYAPQLAAVEQAVRAENRQVVAQHPDDYVSVVLLLPISADKGSILSMANAVEQVRGAYTAQHYANRSNVEGIAPYIQLLIGNDGYQANQWQTAAPVIEHATGQHIAAVTGLGLSLRTTQQAVSDLTAHSIPVFGATITSDTYDNIKNFVRVSPSNQDNMSAALSYVRGDFTRAILVEDGNAGDSYDATLVSGFKKFDAFPGHRIVGVEPYDTSGRDNATDKAAHAQQEAEVETRISQMTGDICTQQPAVVLFAGRGQDLGVLLHALSNTCMDKPIRIVSGDDVTNLPNTAQLRQDLKGHVTVDYAGVAHPDEWTAAHDASARQAEADGARGYDTFVKQYRPLFHATSTADLGDGNTMMAYDATLTAITAIRLAEQRQPRPDAVANELGALQGVHKVLGAGGPIQFTANYQTSHTGSNPVDKAMPILRLQPNGNPRVMTVKWPARTTPVG
ncbi:ABC transporter substrate-binding protein [Streptomyces sp. NPDC001393]